MTMEKKEATRQKIFKVSLTLFTQRGYGNTTIRDIAEAAHISTGLLFHYFPAKSALLTAHLEFASKGIDAVEALLKSDLPPFKAFSLAAELTLSSFNQPVPRLLYLLANQPLPPDSVARTLQKAIRKDRIINASIPLIKEGQAAGIFKAGDSQALAIAFWGAIQGTAELLAVQPTTPIPEPSWVVGILKNDIIV